MLSFKQFSFPPINQNNNNPFDPSPPTKRKWLYTKKKPLPFGITLPGLCQTSDYSTQMLAFFGILVLEAVPTIYGIGQGLLWEAVMATIFVDIFLAIGSHWWHDDITLEKNLLVIEEDAPARKELETSISRRKIYSNLFIFLIIISGITKAFLFYSAYIFFDAIVVGVIVCYLLGAILHINYTGYFIYTSRFYWFIHREFSVYTKTNKNQQLGEYSTNQVKEYPIKTYNAKIDFVTGKQGLHEIYKNEEERYFFKTLGIMTDKELAGFVRSQQSPVTRDVIAREGLAIQLLQFDVSTTENLAIRDNRIVEN